MAWLRVESGRLIGTLTWCNMRWLKFTVRWLLISLIWLIYGLFIFCSCRSVKYVPIETTTDTMVVERLVPVEIPPDSSTIRALMECDENGKVVLKWLDIANSRNAEAQLKIDSLGNLIAKMKTRPDTIYKPSNIIRITTTKKEPYPVEQPLTKWQQFILNIGWYALIIAIVFIALYLKKIIRR